MAEQIVYDYEKMMQTATRIKEIAESYKTAANAFVAAYGAAVSDWTGATKTKLDQYVLGETDSVKSYILGSVPSLIEGLANMIEANANQMSATDQEIADSIPASISGK